MINDYTHVEDFETSNIQYTNEMLTFLLCVQSFVTFLHHVFEKSVEHTLTHGTDGVGYLQRHDNTWLIRTVRTITYNLYYKIDCWRNPMKRKESRVENVVHLLGPCYDLVWRIRFLLWFWVSTSSCTNRRCQYPTIWRHGHLPASVKQNVFLQTSRLNERYVIITSVPSASACSSRPRCLNFMPPMCITEAVIL